jgi:nicotinamidase-related amidase
MTTEAKRALLLIDVQNEYFTGRLPIEYPPVEQSLANIEAAIAFATAQAIPIIVVQQDAPADSPVFAKGSDGWQLHPAVAAAARAHLVSKALPSAFAGTDLHTWLKANDIDTLAVAGYMSHNCVESTIREAGHLGYHVEYLHDAAGTVSYRNRLGALSARQMHEASCIVLQARFAAVLQTAEWTRLVEAGQTARPEGIFPSYLNSRTAEPVAA